ncbi:alpha/beta-hydrolase [Rickenella mellea]|uniref:Alpha/beta-hydrolase n=1 Tax=Rickenella mellea TaxID=50990 RepID=A0A4Y7QBG5_9AGAM|nr:alpha/beta-hydrolase [Rickenella mellea]
MVAVLALFTPLLLVASSWATPLALPGLPRQGAITVNTPVGQATGVVDGGAVRFTVRYATANRWQPSVVATTWTLPNGASDPAALPHACPQDSSVENSQPTSEDCLSVILYVPPVAATKNVPTMLWIHGGSFIEGSATGPGLDGSKLAVATGSIIAVVQYRLGVLGLFPPNGGTNLAVKDVINSLQFLRQTLPSFGGQTSKFTIAGQSSGASMVRALLGTPSAQSLFRSAILHSDPMDFGLLSTTTQSSLQAAFTKSLNCSSSTPTTSAAAAAACYNALPLSTILSAQDDLMSNAASIDPAAGLNEPIRPCLDGTLITSPLDSTHSYPSVNKPLIISTVLNEAGNAIYNYNAFPDPLPGSAFEPVVEATFGQPRTQQICSSTFYGVPTSGNLAIDVRPQIEKLGTDYIWKCSSWTFARNWIAHGGSAHVGMYVVGATYPSNANVPFCASGGGICHEDDIMLLFGTAPNPTSAQAAVTTEIQARYKNFLSANDINPSGMATWAPATTTDVHARVLGGTGEAPVNACTPTFWGATPQYDYQVFNE